MLSVRSVSVYYGAICAIDNVSIEVESGKIVALIGPNGAGKSTLLSAVAGLVAARSGHIELEGRTILGRPAHEIVRGGITLVPEGRRVFPGLTVLENLRLGGYVANNETELQSNLDLVFELFPTMKERTGQRAGLLSGGEQQMLAVGRALMSDPKLLMMDEPSLGLAPMLVRRLFDSIGAVHQKGRTILLAEQNARAALKLADYVYVLETGRVTAQGPADELASDDRIRNAYLGVV